MKSCGTLLASGNTNVATASGRNFRHSSASPAVTSLLAASSLSVVTISIDRQAGGSSRAERTTSCPRRIVSLMLRVEKRGYVKGG
jgi:hypothetical protein